MTKLTLSFVRPLLWSVLSVGLMTPVVNAKSLRSGEAKVTASAKVPKKAVKPLAAPSLKGRRASVAVPARVSTSLAVKAGVVAAVAAPLAFAGDSEPRGLKSNAVLVVDQDTQEVLVSKNGSTVLPIASLTKLMTGLVVTDAGLALDEPIAITEDDVDTLKGSGSRLAVGTTLTRGELLHLALMSSENRAAHALGRTFPGGLQVFVDMMNIKAQMLGMKDTRYVDPTGLSPRNQSSAADLALLAAAAHQRPIMRDLSTSPEYLVDTGRKTLQYRNTNRLVSNPSWDIGLQKTGYISEAGRCLVMQARVAGRQLIMVFLDSAGKFTRLADAERVRRWVESQNL
jgi:D-alanyl-D-alanine endopeptidase (penicillin-binding protein 7)